MTPETQAYWDRTLTGLVSAVGEADARWIAMETAQRMGDGGSTRQWTAMLLKVLAEWARSEGYAGSTVDLVNSLARRTSAVRTAVEPTPDASKS